MIARALSPIVSRLVVAGGLSAAALTPAVLTHFEDTKLEAYQDTGGVWTICTGSTEGVKEGDTATPEMCADLLAKESAKFEGAVERLVTVPMSAPRKTALTSFAYNVGIGNFKRSTLLKRINAQDPNACEELSKWVYVKRKDCRIAKNNCMGIVHRRQAERELCEMGEVANVAGN